MLLVVYTMTLFWTSALPKDYHVACPSFWIREHALPHIMQRQVLCICHPFSGFFFLPSIFFQVLPSSSLVLGPILLLRTHRAHYSHLPSEAGNPLRFH